jgi:hypothetical protein
MKLKLQKALTGREAVLLRNWNESLSDLWWCYRTKEATQYTRRIISQAVPVDASPFLSHLCRQAALEIFCWHLAKGLQETGKRWQRQGSTPGTCWKVCQWSIPQSYEAQTMPNLWPFWSQEGCQTAVEVFNQQPAASRSVFDKQHKHECHQPLLHTSQNRSLAFTPCGFQQPISPVKEA